MHFNSRVWDELGLDCPFTMVREGRWTWPRMVEAATAAMLDLDGDGLVNTPGVDRFGIVATGGDFWRAFYFSTGARVYSTNPITGRVEMALDNPYALEVVQFMREFSQTPGMYCSAPHWPELRQIFLDGKALFISSQVDTDLRMMEDDFGMLPMPKWDEAQPHHIGVIDHNGTLFGVPVTVRNLDATGVVLDALARQFMHVDDIRLAEMADTFYREDDSEDMLLNYVRGTTTTDLSLFMGWHPTLGVPNGIILSAVGGSHADIAAEVAMIREVIEYQLSEFFGYDYE
jgi:hypothetical protein